MCSCWLDSTASIFFVLPLPTIAQHRSSTVNPSPRGARRGRWRKRRPDRSPQNQQAGAVPLTNARSRKLVCPFANNEITHTRGRFDSARNASKDDQTHTPQDIRFGWLPIPLWALAYPKKRRKKNKEKGKLKK